MNWLFFTMLRNGPALDTGQMFLNLFHSSHTLAR